MGELVRQAQAGDKAAFAQLTIRYRARIVALCLHISGNASEAEDIAQEVFLNCYLKISSFEGRSHFFTWLYRMAVNRSLNARRSKNRRQQRVILDPRIDRAVAVDARQNPALAIEMRRLYAHLLEALDDLPDDMCASVVLVFLQGLSHKEAAAILGCNTKTIAWRIHKSRKKLREARLQYLREGATKTDETGTVDVLAQLRASLRLTPV